MYSKTLSGFALGLLLVTVACGGGGETEAPAATAAPAAAASSVDEATAGNITGSVMFEGEVPANEAIRMNADPACLTAAPGEQLQETYVVGPGGEFGNVFVYVKEGLEGYSFPTPTEPVVLNQMGCRYTPHVFGIRVGQPLSIVNSDNTLHNIHATPDNNGEFNTGQPIQGMKTEHVFDTPEIMVPFKCDVHGWMNATVGVVDHPYFAVTAADGTFSLNMLPPGTYTIEAVHERLGTQTQTVTVGEMQTAEVTFTFQAPAGN
jgi:plastocyanin